MSQSMWRLAAWRGRVIGLLAAGVWLAAIVGPAFAQAVKYDQFKRPAGFDVAKQAAVQSDLAAGNAPADKDLQDFFVAKFADMTNPAKDKDIHKIRADIKKLLQTSGNAASTAGHDKANAFLLKHLPRLIIGAKPNLHLAVRYNLAMLLADLDSVERKGQSSPPTPLPEARAELLKLVGNTKAPDYIRLAALNGTLRHAALSTDAAARAEIAKGVLAFLDELDKAGDAARKQDVKNWLEVRAMETLGATETPTPDVVAALQKRLSDANRPIWTRSAAALALGKLKYDPGAQFDTAGLLAGFKSLLETAVDQGATRRELREVIYSIRRGMNGFDDEAANTLFKLMDAAQQSESTQMTNAMSKMAEVCESKDQPTEARVAIAIKEVMQDWRDGKFSSTLDADAQKNLSEDQTSGEAGEDGGDDSGFDFNSLDPGTAE